MHTSPKTRRTVLAAGACLLPLWLAAAAPARAAANDLVIGQVAPITGVIAGTGNEYVAGAAAYFAQVNAKGGINGRKIRVVLRDDSYKPAATLEHTKEILAKENPIALFGFVGTANIAALLKDKVLSDHRIALLAPYTGAQELRGPNPYLFHIRASYGDETAAMVKHLHTIGLRRFAVFHQNDGFGKNGLDGAVAAMSKLGLEPPVVGHYERTKPEDVDEAVSRIAAGAPDAVIMVSVNRASAAFIKKLRATGSSARLFSISVVNFKELLKNAGEDMARGIGISQVMPYPYTPSSPVAREFLAAMKQYAPDKTISYASIESFIAAKVLVEAIRRAGPDPTRERVLAALDGLREYDAGGFRVGFKAADHVGSGFVDVTVIGRDGRLLR